VVGTPAGRVSNDRTDREMIRSAADDSSGGEPSRTRLVG
jgi:hypothetical protein